MRLINSKKGRYVANKQLKKGRYVANKQLKKADIWLIIDF